jgi:septal ring factor EnvC (AmiA/AmiB activator)
MENKMLTKFLLFLGVVLLMVTFSTTIGLGVWAYSLNTQLTQAHADYQTLKSAQDKLNDQYNKLGADSSKTQADLQAAQAQINSLQDQLKQAQGENDTLNAKISAIQTKVTIIYALEFDSESAFETKVNASGDDQLKKLWATAKDTKSRDDFIKLWDYVIQSVADTAGVSWPSIPLESGGQSG